MKLTLKIWRQKSASDKGKLVDYKVDDVSSDMSFLEMLDVLNQDLIDKNEEPIAFDHDCREGICGACSLVINGYPHGQKSATTTSPDLLTAIPLGCSKFPILKPALKKNVSIV